MSLKYVLAERAGLKLQPQNGWRNMRVSHLSSSQLVSRRTQIYLSIHLRSSSVKTGSGGGGEKQIRASFPCKCMKTRAGGGETERGGEKREVVMVGGNGWEPRFCVSVCAQPLPRKTRSERRWDLISAWRHGRKLVPLGGEVGGLEGWRGGLHFMSSQRKRGRDSETEQSSSLHSPPNQLRWLVYSHRLCGCRI